MYVDSQTAEHLNKRNNEGMREDVNQQVNVLASAYARPYEYVYACMSCTYVM